MRTVKTVEELRKILNPLRRKGKTIGFVPTMGALHEGHLTLMRRAKKECDVCVVSIFVNPKQFGPHEDLSRYPRDFKRDASMSFKENVDIMFFPSDNVVYPKRYLTCIDVENISNVLCGAFRPGHFKGVATVVAKLLNMVQPDVLYLGQKDAQQVAVLTAMIADLNFPIKVQVVPTAREADGLAMSSRNVYLTSRERQEATVLYQALSQAQTQVKKGERSAAKIIKAIKALISKQSAGKIQYVACVDANTLEPLIKLNGHVLIAVAVFFGQTRLIDNVIVPINEPRKIKN